ncbi:MAG TPA: hypothetical protein VNJ08_09675 [Bacteriovoracaceae bacterium]|nr:hypothetical protein [Bacteriovoracaceae bacterium]
MNQQVPDYQAVMLNELSYRKSSNPAYSLRSFARDLGLSPSRLSEILTRKGDLSPEKAGPVAIMLGLRNKEVNLFR